MTNNLESISHNIISMEKADFPGLDTVNPDDEILITMKGTVNKEDGGRVYIEINEAGIEPAQTSNVPLMREDARDGDKQMDRYILHLSKGGQRLENVFSTPPASGKIAGLHR